MSDNYIQILDYGIGNVRSLKNALNKIEINNLLSDKIDTFDTKLRGLIIPGVGSFPSAINLLKSKNLIESIKSLNKNNLPILGICLGMQILLNEGTEGEKTKGLGFFDGTVIELDRKKMQIPNIGWRKIIGEDNLINSLQNKKFYFVHSYYVNPSNKEYIKYYINYENFKIPAIIRKNNLIGFQFHPEKSGEDGLNLLKEFCNLGMKNVIKS